MLCLVFCRFGSILINIMNCFSNCCAIFYWLWIWLWLWIRLRIYWSRVTILDIHNIFNKISMRVCKLALITNLGNFFSAVSWFTISLHLTEISRIIGYRRNIKISEVIICTKRTIFPSLTCKSDLANGIRNRLTTIVQHLITVCINIMDRLVNETVIC